MVIILLKLPPGPNNALLKCDRLFVFEVRPDLLKLYLLASRVFERALDKVGFRKVLVAGLCGLDEVVVEVLARPLDRVLDLVREVFDRATWSLSLWRVLRRAVRFSEVRDDHLSVAFRAKCTGFEEWFLKENATLVHVETRFDVVERVGNSIKSREEVVAVFGCR